MTNNPDKDFSPIVSPDNKFIYFTSNRTGANQIWRMNASGGDEKQITQNEGGYGCVVSSDGKWIYYLSGLRETLWKVSADGGGETQISERKMISPAVSPDGGKAAYFFRDNTADNQIKLAVLSIEDKKILKIITFPAEKSAPGKIAWSKDNQTFYCIVKSESKNLLWRQSLSDEKSSLLNDLGDEQISSFALAADEKDYLFVRGKWVHDAVLIAGLK